MKKGIKTIKQNSKTNKTEKRNKRIPVSDFEKDLLHDSLVLKRRELIDIKENFEEYFIKSEIFKKLDRCIKDSSGHEDINIFMKRLMSEERLKSFENLTKMIDACVLLIKKIKKN